MMNAALPPPNRGQDTMSPISVGSEWSGVNIYNTSRSDSSYTNFDNQISPMSDGNLPRQNGFGPPPFDRQRRPSESGSRQSSRTPSIAPSRSSDGTISDNQSRKYRRMEAELAQHYAVLRTYLRGGNAHPPRPNKARDKLLRLSPIQFHELSTDVFDELQRRQALAPANGRLPPRDRIPPFLQPRQDFHEKRNQARQKLSSLQTPRFRDLSTDVFCELERRFPQFARPDGRPPSRGIPRGPNGIPPRTHSSNPSVSSNAPGFPLRGQSTEDFGRPMQRQFQSNTIMPNKSTMIEDEDEMAGVDSRYERSSDAFGLESALTSPRSNRDTSVTSQSLGSKTGQFQMASLEAEIGDLKEQLRAKDDALQQAQSSADQRELQQDLEDKLRDAEQLNQNMQAQLDRIRRDHTNVERDLRAELEAAKQAGENSRVAPEVAQENEELREQLREQDEIIEDVRKQAKLYLDEMRAMAESGGGNFEREEKLQSEVNRMEEELKEWKAKYVRTKTQLRSVRASSLGLSISRTDVLQHARDGALYDQAGAVKDVNVTRFQISIDELLRVARQDPSGVLEHMKTVVMAVRSITTDIEGSTPSLKDEEAMKKRTKMKSKVSATANNVITASKNYAAAGGLSPVSLLDAAASHLTAAVVDLVRTVKIKPTPPGELQDVDEGSLEPIQGNGYFNIADNIRRRSAVDSVYSAISTPEDTNGGPRPGSSSHRRTNSSYKNGNGLNGMSNGLGIKPGLGLGQEDADLEDLKVYIEDQSDQLVESIQVLIEAIRREESMNNIRNNIERIASTVEAVLAASDKGAQDATSYRSEWHSQTGPIRSNLEDCKNQLLQAGDDSQGYDDNASSKAFTQKLPPLAFQVARETRELVRRLQNIRAGGSGDDDFS